LDANSQGLAIEERSATTKSSTASSGPQQLLSKMILELTAIDPDSAPKIIDLWKNMVSTTAKRDKTLPFANLEEYIAYRSIDAGGP
jgi:hypothetical protein